MKKPTHRPLPVLAASATARGDAATRSDSYGHAHSRGPRRKKDPVGVRQKLLRAVSDIAVQHGIQDITLDSVAQRAGVTKGALQYHFKNKQGLIDALYEQTIERFQGQMERRMEADEGNRQGVRARAYLHGIQEDLAAPAEADVLRVLTAHMLTDQDIRERYCAPMRSWMMPDPLPLAWSARTMICRLAADGLSISRLLGYQDVIPEDLRLEILRQLDALTVQGE